MKRFLIVLLLILAVAGTAHGIDTGIDVPGMDKLLDAAQEQDVEAGEGFEEGISALLKKASGQINFLLRSGLKTGVVLLIVATLCSLAESTAALGNSQIVKVTEISGALAVTALSVGEMGTMVGLGRETIQNMDQFAGLILPVMAVLTAATGKASAAAMGQAVTILFSDLLITMIDRLLIPLVYAYIASSCASAAMGNDGLKRISGFIKKAVTSILSGFMLIYVAYLTVSGTIAGSTDAAAVKAAKMAVSRAVPVVGGILSDAAETLLVGAGVLKGTIGVVGMLTVLSICLIPFLRLGTHYLTFKLTGALTGTVASGRLSGLIEDISSAFGLILGMTGSCALLLLISLVSAISVVLA